MGHRSEIIYENRMTCYKNLPYNRIVRWSDGTIVLQIFERHRGMARIRVRSMIDFEDIPLVSRYRWSYNGKYIITSKPTVGLHRLIAFQSFSLAIASINEHLDVHHKRSILNNRRSNLEILEKTEHRAKHCKESPHGTINRYRKYHCRCTECQKAIEEHRKRERKRAKIRRRKERELKILEELENL